MSRLRDLGVWYVYFSLGYLGVAWYQGAPRFDPEVAWDALIPFVPLSILVYVSQYVLLVTAASFAKRHELFFRRLYLVSTAGFLCFLVFPTQIDRPAPVNLLYEWLYRFDPPVNCFPSLHTAIAFVSAAALGPWAFAWASGIALSTVLTKQHYLIDTFAGLVLAGAVCWIRAPKSVSVSR